MESNCCEKCKGFQIETDPPFRPYDTCFKTDCKCHTEQKGWREPKICTKCEKAERLVWSHSYCRDCYRAVDRRRYYKKRDSRLELRRKLYEKLTPLQKKERSALSKQRNPEKWWARQTLRNAITRGEIMRLPCEKCGKTPSHGHHTDYSKPLQVQWLCVDHHYQEHRRYDEGKQRPAPLIKDTPPLKAKE